MSDTSAFLTILGGARTVTGSKFLIEHGGRRVLVDCGLFQGLKELRERNWAAFPIEPRSIDAVVITHAHLDHCGYLPWLVRGGFTGPVHVTYDTGRLMSVVLPDSGRLLEEEARFANRAGYSRHDPALALYTEDDAWRSLDLLRPAPFGEPIEVAPGISITFRRAGHILGSAGVEASIGRRDPVVVRFSGDLGRQQHPLLLPPEPVGAADWVVVESTYGDRIHQSDDSVERLADLIDRTVARGGVVIIPAFAVDRTEVLLDHLHDLAHEGRLPQVPIYVDSPMALAALDIYRAVLAEHAVDLRPEMWDHGDVFDLPGMVEVHDTEGSKRVSRDSRPGIIIAGAGMASGGRVVHHLARHLPNPRNSVGLVGFQAAGTRGRALLEGATSVKIHGQYVRVRAEIADLTGFSVHADADELIGWLRTAEREPAGVFVVHGEPDSAAALQARIAGELDGNGIVPRHGERLRLGIDHGEAGTRQAAGMTSPLTPPPMSPLISPRLTELAATISTALRARGETISVAEGSAGGLVSATLLAVPGASAYYVGGSVIYTAAAYRGFLAGAVPPPPGMRGATEGFAAHLAESVATRLGTTWGLGEAGAAGPPNPYGDPAGHVWVAVHGPRSATRHLLTGLDDRGHNMVAFATAALELLAETLADETLADG